VKSPSRLFFLGIFCRAFGEWAIKMLLYSAFIGVFFLSPAFRSLLSSLLPVHCRSLWRGGGISFLVSSSFDCRGTRPVAIYFLSLFTSVTFFSRLVPGWSCWDLRCPFFPAPLFCFRVEERSPLVFLRDPLAGPNHFECRPTPLPRPLCLVHSHSLTPRLRR